MVSIPCEGGWAWSLGRRLSTNRYFSRKGIDYLAANVIDHCNTASQVARALRRHFEVVATRWFPLVFPSFSCNLVLAYRLTRKAQG